MKKTKAEAEAEARMHADTPAQAVEFSEAEIEGVIARLEARLEQREAEIEKLEGFIAAWKKKRMTAEGIER